MKSNVRVLKPGEYRVNGVRVYLLEPITEEEFEALVKWAKKHGG